MDQSHTALLDAPKNRYQATHPVVVAMSIEGIKWQQFMGHFEDGDVAKIIAAQPKGGRMVAWLACLDEAVAEKIEDGWGA